MPAYTLEMLDECDVERILPMYFWYCRTHGENADGEAVTPQTQIVMRDGKPYKVVKPQDAGWLGNMMH